MQDGLQTGKKGKDGMAEGKGERGKKWGHLVADMDRSKVSSLVQI